jgi:hypothetical protein
MRKLPLLALFVLAIIATSCSKKSPEITKSIPDEAFVVASFHPKQLYDKGQIATFENVFSKIDNEVILTILKDPGQSGIKMDEYAFVFSYFVDDESVVGATAVLKDKEAFSKLIRNLIDSEGKEFEITEIEGYSLFAPENEETGMMWNEEQLIFLSTPDKNKSTAEWQTMLSPLFELEKENAVTSIVDFNDFTGKMKDINFWVTGDEFKKLIEKSGMMDQMDFNFPMELYNNYSQHFVDFDNGAMYLHSETHFSDDVKKAAETFLMAKENLNERLLELTPGNNLLLAMAFSLELDKIVDLMKNFSPPEMDTVSGKIEKATGIPGKDILDALNGDFVIAVNGAPEGSSIPVEILIGIGLDDESLQKRLMGTVENMADVQKDGDFFMINANGVELYSGIVDGIWVITNTSGYKDAVTGSGLEKSLKDSKFSEYTDGSMGMYVNLDLTTYPAALQGMMSSGSAPEILELLIASFEYLGMEASNKAYDMTLKTTKDDENSLHTILKFMEQAAKNK